MEETTNDWEKRVEAVLRQIAGSELSERNKKLIQSFGDECFTVGLGYARVAKYLHYLLHLARWLGKDFDDCTIEDIKKLVGMIEKSKYANSSKKEYKICLKKLYRWLKGTYEDYPPQVRWIKPSNGKAQKRKLPEDMMNEKDIRLLIDAASKPRDKAFVSVLYETGCRIAEHLFLKIRSIKFDEQGAVITVPCMKTGSRRVRIVSSVPLLTDWLNSHPSKNNPDSYLWPSTNSQVMSYSLVRKLLVALAKKAGIKKKVNPHNFRHSRATHMANFLTEAQMKEYFGWIQASDMAAIYVHLSGRDVDNAVLKMYGRSNAEQSEVSILTPKSCGRCEQENPSGNKFCSRCGMPLDTQTMNEVIRSDLERKHADSFMDGLLNDPKFRAIFEEKLREMSRNRN